MKEMDSTYRSTAALLVGFLTLIIGSSNFFDATETGNPFADLKTFAADSKYTNPIKDVLRHPRSVSSLRPEQVDSETLWLARAIFSETKRAEEQVLVAWVIRNRVETGYRGKKGYQSVILDPYQFSAFRKGTAQRSFYSGLNASSDLPGWKLALRIAYDVRRYAPDDRPFSELTRHFYSQRSMNTERSPTWANGKMPVALNGLVRIDENRFMFFEGIS